MNSRVCLVFFVDIAACFFYGTKAAAFCFRCCDVVTDNPELSIGGSAFILVLLFCVAVSGEVDVDVGETEDDAGWKRKPSSGC